MSDDRRVDVEFGAKLGGLAAGASEAAGIVRQTTTEMKSQFAGLAGAASAVTAPLLAISAILAGGAIFGRAISAAADLGEHLQVLSQKTGVQADELSRLEYAAKLGDTGVENLDAGLVKLARSMDEARGGTGTAAEAMKALGISATDSHGQLRPVRDVLLEVATKFAGMQDGAGKAALAMEIFGKAGTSMIPMLNLGAAGIAKLEEEANRLGATMSNEGAQAAADYGDAMDRLHAMTEGMWRTIAVSVMPTLTALADAFTSTSGGGEILAGTVEVIAGAFRFAGTVIVATKFLFEETYETIRLVLEGIANVFVGTSMAAIAAAKGNFGEAGQIVRGTFRTMADDVHASSKRMEDDATNAATALRRLYGFETAPSSPTGSGTPKHAAPQTHKPDTKKTPKADERLSAWREELAAIKAADDVGKDALLADEIAFWQTKLALIHGGTKADLKLREQVRTQIAALDKQLHADEREALRVRNETRRQGELDALDVQRQSIEEQRSLRQLDANEAEAQLIALNQRMTAIRMAGLEEQRAAAAGDVVAIAKIDQQIEALKRASAHEITAISKNTTETIAGDWENVFGHITNVFSQSVQGIIQGTQSLRGALRGIFQNITLDFLASKAQELKHHIAIELAKRGVTTATAAHKVLVEGAAALKSLAITAATAIKEIAIHAARAAAAAFAAIAGIPFVGPVLAPIAAAVALASVLALGSRVASASGGYDVPAGVNPVTQLHAEEMVLPASLANAVRAMATGGNSGSGGGGGDVVHLTVHAMDARTFTDFVRRNPSAFAAGIHSAVRSGHATRRT